MDTIIVLLGSIKPVFADSCSTSHIITCASTRLSPLKYRWNVRIWCMLTESQDMDALSWLVLMEAFDITIKTMKQRQSLFIRLLIGCIASTFNYIFHFQVVFNSFARVHLFLSFAVGHGFCACCIWAASDPIWVFSVRCWLFCSLIPFSVRLFLIFLLLIYLFFQTQIFIINVLGPALECVFFFRETISLIHQFKVLRLQLMDVIFKRPSLLT